ncbi:MAG: hypothetical protein HY466_02040 [Deltaproteobacteria bacterium]|nr:hypothetical protein [Deltaproteobacteria bacterium]
MSKIRLNLELHGKWVDLKPPREEDYPALQKILSDSKTMAGLKYMAHLEKGGWTLEQVRERCEQQKEGQNKGTDLHFIVHLKKMG